MVKTPDREKTIRAIIKANPQLSGYKIYDKYRGTPLGIQKQRFYQVYREERKLPEPSREVRYRSIPKRYRTTAKPVRKPEIIPIKPTQLPDEYIRETLVDIRNDDLYYICYNNREGRLRALKTLSQKGGKNSEGVNLAYLQMVSRARYEYIDEPFGEDEILYHS